MYYAGSLYVLVSLVDMMFMLDLTTF